jgi:hypothetical protein
MSLLVYQAKRTVSTSLWESEQGHVSYVWSRIMLRKLILLDRIRRKGEKRKKTKRKEMRRSSECQTSWRHNLSSSFLSFLSFLSSSSSSLASSCEIGSQYHRKQWPIVSTWLFYALSIYFHCFSLYLLLLFLLLTSWDMQESIKIERKSEASHLCSTVQCARRSLSILLFDLSIVKKKYCRSKHQWVYDWWFWLFWMN